jgi:hypothetical protein
MYVCVYHARDSNYHEFIDPPAIPRECRIAGTLPDGWSKVTGLVHGGWTGMNSEELGHEHTKRAGGSPSTDCTAARRRAARLPANPLPLATSPTANAQPPSYGEKGNSLQKRRRRIITRTECQGQSVRTSGSRREIRVSSRLQISARALSTFPTQRVYPAYAMTGGKQIEYPIPVTYRHAGGIKTARRTNEGVE